MREINWAGLSPRGKRILREIAVLLAPPLSYEEVEDSPSNLSYSEAADYLQARRGTIADLRPPDPVTTAWVSARMKELRRDARDASSTS